jgi:hemerythrin-like metal-binding protein
MHTDKLFEDYKSEILDMRARFMRGFLRSVRNIVLGVFRGRGNYSADAHSLSGSGVIDAQHESLSDHANNLRARLLFERPVDEVNAIIDAFLRDLVRHFQDEEVILAASNYPGTAKHSALHRELLNSADRHVKQFRADASTIGKLFQFLTDDVLAKHMRDADQAFLSYLEGRLTMQQAAA